MKIAEVNRNLVPMYIGFEEKDVEYICETLGNSIHQSYEIIGMFSDYGLIEDDE